MRAIKKTLLEVLVLAIVGLGLAFTVNSVRAKGSLKVSKDYFETGFPQVRAETGVEVAAASKEAKVEQVHAASPEVRSLPVEGDAAKPAATAETPQSERAATKTAAPTPAEPDETADAPGSGGEGAKAEQAEVKEGGHIQHDYQSITLKDVIDVFHDPLTSKGLNTFIDARNDQHFEEGHIPGAVQFDPYQVEQYLEGALAKANAAEKVIVYCTGGDCEDSIFACRELLAAGVPYESIYLFEGGWKQWKAADQPVSEGREE